MDNNVDKLKQDLIKQFNKEFGENSLEVMSESTLADIPGWITTGNYALNWIMSKSIYKGAPMGRVILYSGDPGAGKSLLALSMMRSKEIDLVVYFDSEGGGVTNEFANFIGLNTDKVMYNPIDTVEDLFKKMEKLVDVIEKNKDTRNILMVIDSFSMITTEREKDPNAGSDMGNKAKLTRSFFRTYLRKLQKLNCAVVMTSHLTENIGGYGPTKMVGGGTALGYVPSLEVRFSRVNAESETEKNAIGTSLVKIKAEVIKSRFGTQGKIGKFDLDMEKGLDPYAGLFDIMKDYGYIIPAASDFEAQIQDKEIPKKSTGWWAFKPFDNDKTIAIHKEIMDKGLTNSGKFREAQIKEFCKDNPWFLDRINELLTDFESDDVMPPVEEKEDKRQKKTTQIIDINTTPKDSGANENAEDEEDIEDKILQQLNEEQ
jgi:RecA/RadA recombinase